MKIDILTPSQHITSDEAEELYAVGPKGEFGILPGHDEYISPLTMGQLLYRKSGKTHRYLVSGGYLVASQNSVQVLADEVEKPEQIDAQAVRQRLQALEKKLLEESLSVEDFQKALEDRDKEQVKLEILS